MKGAGMYHSCLKRGSIFQKSRLNYASLVYYYFRFIIIPPTRANDGRYELQKKQETGRTLCVSLTEIID
jgi:hypothetical protein